MATLIALPALAAAFNADAICSASSAVWPAFNAVPTSSATVAASPARPAASSAPLPNHLSTLDVMSSVRVPPLPILIKRRCFDKGNAGSPFALV